MDTFNSIKALLCQEFKRVRECLSCEEQQTLLIVAKRPDALSELSELLAFRPSTPYFPRSMVALLRDWDKTLDQSRNQPLRTKSGKTLIDKQLEEIERL